MTTPFLVKPSPEHGPLTVEQLLDILSPDKLNKIDRAAKIMRETYQCPYTVRDYEHFKDTVFDYFVHYQKEFFGIDIRKKGIDQEYWRQWAYFNFFEKHLGAYPGGISAAERNSQQGREGAMITVIDLLTDSIVKLHTETYVKAVFLELIAPSDYRTKIRLAEAILTKFGRFLFPGEELQPGFLLGMHLEEFIQSFINHLHGIRREWRH